MSGAAAGRGASRTVVVIGAGIVGVSAALWLIRSGCSVTLVDRAPPGSATSSGNAGVLAACSVTPVTAPGLLGKAPGMLLNPDFPLFLRWSYLPRLAPWLLRYLAHANEADTRRIAGALPVITADSVAQHKALAGNGAAAAFLRESDYAFAYRDRAVMESDPLTWLLRRAAGFEPVVIEGAAVRDYEPALSTQIDCLAVMKDHGFVVNPRAYVAALADEFTAAGGRFVSADVTGFERDGAGRVSAVTTAREAFSCDAAVVAAGVWSKALAKSIGLAVPLESERGYHLFFRGASAMPQRPVMVAAGKFVATPMEGGLRCAGVVEFGGTAAGPSKAPLALLRRQALAAFPGLEAEAEESWLGHRPAPADSLPLIGEIADSGIFAAFGHHHIGLTGGPKTGRIIAGLITGRAPDADISAFDPNRFA